MSIDIRMVLFWFLNYPLSCSFVNVAPFQCNREDSWSQ